MSETVAVVVVTYNRASLLTRMLAGLAALDHAPDAVIVVDNASTDHTRTVLDGAREVHSDLPLQVIRPEQNLGGSGGFRRTKRTASTPTPRSSGFMIPATFGRRLGIMSPS